MSSPLRVELELDDGSFTARMIHAGETVDQFVQNVGRGVSGVSRMGEEVDSLGERLKTLTFGFWVAREAIHDLESMTTGWIGEIVKINAEVERMTSSMKALSTVKDPIAEATAYITNLREEAKNAPFALQTMHQSFLRLASTGLDAKQSITALTDAVAAFGGTDENLSRASLAFQEMAGKGVVQMKELRNQLGMSIPNAIPLLARSLGVSYSELVDDIHTGTVDAKSAITALNAEIERTFGGAAAAQMKTFNGEIASMKVRLQDIAITQIGGGDTGFFGEIKRDLSDLNAMLSGPAAEGIGQMIGSGLTVGVQTIRSLITEVVEFKDEIAAAGQVFLYGLGARAIWAGVEYGVSKVQSLRQELTLLSLAGRTARESVELNNMGNAIYQMNLVGQNGQRLGLSNFETMNRSAGAALGLFATGISTVLPWLALLGPAVIGVADYFGVFSDKTHEAFSNLERFGAASVEAAKKGDAFVASLQQRIDILKALKDAPDFDGTGAAFSGTTDAQIAELEKQLEDAKKKQAGFLQQGSQEDAKSYVAKQMASYTDAKAALERSYNATAVKLAQQWDVQKKELDKTFKDSRDAEQAYRAAKQAENLRLYDAELAKIDELRAAQEKLAGSAGDAQQAKNASDAVAALNAEYVRVNEQRSAAQTSGVIMNPKGFDAEKLFKKGEDALEKMRAKLQGFVEGVEDGADPAVVELDRLLSGLKLGDPAVEGVQKLRQEIVDAKEMADELNDAMKGQKKFEKDLDSVTESYKEQIFKAKYGDLSEIDQLGIKVQQGLYKGVGPNRAAVEDLLARAKQELAAVDGGANQVGTTLATKAFGSETQAAVKTVADYLKEAADATGRMSTNLAQLDVGGAMDKLKGGLADFGMFNGGGGGSFLDKLLTREGTGKNPNSSAQGVGQFIDSTWRAFLTSRHPELPQDDASIKAQRQDRGLGVEATEWYKQQNAHDLQKAGYDPTDANLYMSHLLGSGGAKQVLSADPTAKIADLSDKLARAVAANPFLRGETAGGLQTKLNAQFGTGYTGLGGRPRVSGNVGPDYTPGMIPDGLPNDGDRQKFADAQQLAKDAEVATKQRALDTKITELREKLATLNIRVDDSKGKSYGDLLTAIKLGKAGPSKDPSDSQNKEALDIAEQVDKAQKALDDAKKTRTAADSAMEQTKRDMRAAQVESQEIFARAGDPNGLGRSAELVRKMQQGNEALSKIADDPSRGKESDDYKQQLAANADLEQSYRNNEIAKNIEALREKTGKLRESLMDQDDSRESAFNREKKRLEDELAAFKGTAEQKKILTEDLNAYIAAGSQKLAMSGPLAKEMKGWGDMTGNMEKSVTSWMSTSTDALTSLITTGKTNWQSLSQTMTKDMVNMGLRYGMSSLFGGVTGKGTGGASKIAGGASKLPKFATGGQISGPGTGTSDSMMARVSNGEFVVNAEATRKNLGLLHALNSGRMPAFAAGGEIDTSALPAAAGGRNFTPEMVDTAMSGRAPGATHNWNITTELHAQGGSTPENQDLARRASAEMEASVRRVALDEIMRQHRPGGALHG